MSAVETVQNSFLCGPIRANTLTRPSDTTAYAARDVISNITTNAHFTIGTLLSVVPGGSASMSRQGTLTGVINQIQLFSSVSDTKGDMELWLFEYDIANVADNAAFAISDAEALTRVAVIDIPLYKWKVGGANSSVQIANIDIPYRAATGVLYGQLVVATAFTPTSGETYTLDVFRTID